MSWQKKKDLSFFRYYFCLNPSFSLAAFWGGHKRSSWFSMVAWWKGPLCLGFSVKGNFHVKEWFFFFKAIGLYTEWVFTGALLYPFRSKLFTSLGEWKQTSFWYATKDLCLFLFLLNWPRVAQWWEHSPPTNVAGVQTPVLACGLSLLLVLSLAARGFSPGTPVFPSHQKPTFPNSNSTRNQVDEEPLRGCPPPNHYSLLLFIIIHQCVVFLAD